MNASHAVDAITFDLVNINQGGLYNLSSGLVTITTAGYYYIYISVASEPGQVSVYV